MGTCAFTRTKWCDRAECIIKECQAEHYMVRAQLAPGIEPTPEINAWLDVVDAKINEELHLQLRNLAAFGTTHPEINRGPTR